MDFGGQYAIYKGLAFYGIKPNENLEWGFGLNLSTGFRRSTILPFFLYNRNFNDRWGLESALPAYIFGRLNLGRKSIMLLGAEYSSGSYRLGVNSSNKSLLDYALNHSEIIGSLRLEQQLSSWLWANVKVGYQLNFSTDFDSKAINTSSFQVEPADGFFFRIGAFISPPDDVFRS
ncbi:MAG: hypothetical protein IPL46_04565 [Saprospiraceae bacterium]|nr:hypothetical protein [Saprospiraceae bacterium]